MRLTRVKPYPVIGIITVSPITDIAFIEDSFNKRHIAAFILQPHTFTVLPELYASGYNIPVYFIPDTSPVYLNAIDELHIFCRSSDETPLIMDACDEAHKRVEIHIIP
jgi:hypothetical protein